jgi:hypothetical protein
MNPTLNQELANVVVRERLEQAEQARLAKAVRRFKPEPRHGFRVRRPW